MSRRRDRKNDRKTRPSQRNASSQPKPTTGFVEPPPQVWSDVSKMRIGDGAYGPPPVGERGGDDQGNRTYQTGFGSAGNAVKSGRRSRLLFPDAMRQAIDEAIAGYSAEIRPRTALERWLVSQLARGSVQSDLAGEQLNTNRSLAIERVDTRWADDRREEAEALGKRLATEPEFIAGKLGRSRYGALYLIERLTRMGQVIAEHGCLNEEQRALLFDLRGVNPVYRNGNFEVPPGHDGPGLAAAVEEEKARLSAKLQSNLIRNDELAQESARYGIVKTYDQETKNLRSDQARADRRFRWAWAVLHQVRAGVDPATIIDPETKKPIVPEPEAPSAAPEPAQAAAPSTTSTPTEESPSEESPSASSSESESRTRRIPDDIPEELRQMFHLVGEAFFRKPESGQAEEPGPGSA